MDVVHLYLEKGSELPNYKTSIPFWNLQNMFFIEEVCALNCLYGTKRFYEI
jgi:hypothetical protein